MLLSSYDHCFIVQATVITIVNYDPTVITIVNYDHKTFIVQTTEELLRLRGKVRENKRKIQKDSAFDLQSGKII